MNIFSCQYCHKKYKNEGSFKKHTCVQKTRHDNKNTPTNRIAFQCWSKYYKQNKSYNDFINNSYYTIFVKFVTYCLDINVIDIMSYADWLYRNNYRIDHWIKDSNYTKFIIWYLQNENAFDALSRSMKMCMTITEDISTTFKNGNVNKICHAITNGKISPWLLLNCYSGIEFLDKLDQSQLKLISDYIDTKIWTNKLKNDTNTTEIRDILKQGNF